MQAQMFANYLRTFDFAGLDVLASLRLVRCTLLLVLADCLFAQVTA
jgi:hypothetical protein